MTTFLTALAWIFGSIATMLLLARILGAVLYTERDRLLDNMRGMEKTWPVATPGAIAIVCWAWVIWGGK